MQSGAQPKPAQTREPADPGPLPAPGSQPPDLLLLAGEHSGDEHAAKLVADLRKREPELTVAALGGPKLEAAGAQLLYNLTEVSIVGFVEVLRHYPFFRRLFERTLAWIERYRPRHICLVDYPGFNLRLAALLRARGLSRKGGGGIGVHYYIAPQVWAWKAKRRFTMARSVDRLGVLFPFEVGVFADTQLPAEFVGHPFVHPDHVPPFVYQRGAPVLLLPGSRSGAVGRIFPVLLQALAKARKTRPGLTARVVYPSAGILVLLKQMAEKYPDIRDAIEWVSNDVRELPAGAVLMSSGTMSLDCALSGIPGAIVYRLHPASYWIGRWLIRIPYIGIANLLLDRPLYPEYIQGAAAPDLLGGELLRALEDPRAEERAAEGAGELKQLLRADGTVRAAEWLARGLEER